MLNSNLQFIHKNVFSMNYKDQKALLVQPMSIGYAKAIKYFHTAHLNSNLYTNALPKIIQVSSLCFKMKTQQLENLNRSGGQAFHLKTLELFSSESYIGCLTSKHQSLLTAFKLQFLICKMKAGLRAQASLIHLMIMVWIFLRITFQFKMYLTF